MHNKRIFIASALIILAACSCSKYPVQKKSALRLNVEGAEYTKSTPTTTSSLRESGKFVLEAWLDDEWKDFSDPDAATKPANPAGQYITSGGNYNVKYTAADGWKTTSEYMWIAEDLTRFFCYYPDDASVNSDATGKRTFTSRGQSLGDQMVFDYTLPKHTTANKDADAQQDLIFAYTEKKFTDGSTPSIDIHFKHALSLINFCVGMDDGTFDTSLIISDISLKGVANSGNCVFSGKGTPMFDWTLAAGTSDFTQTYNAVFSGASTSGWEKGTYKNGDDTYQLRTCTNAFFMIPQTLSGAKLQITFANTGEASDKVITVNLPADTWESGKYYTYKIGATTIGREIKVTVTLSDWDNYDDKLLF